MCAVSYIGDYWRDQFPQKHPWIQPWPYIPVQPYVPPPPSPSLPPWTPMPKPEYPGSSISGTPTPWVPRIVKGHQVTQKEIDALRDEIKELKKLLKAAQAYDAATGEPSCETDEKIEAIRAVAKFVGIDITDVFPNGKVG